MPLPCYGLAAKIGQDRLFPTLPTAVAAYRQWAAEQEQRPGGESGGSRESAGGTTCTSRVSWA